MDDLDSLLVDLGKRKDSMNSQRKTRPPTSRVDLNELASLMEVLAAPSNGTPGSPQPSSNPSFDQLSGASRPVSFMSTPSQSSSGRKDTTVDDLDALMESLSATASSSAPPPSSNHAPPLASQRGQQGGTVGKQLGSQFFSFAEPSVDQPTTSTAPDSRPVSGFPIADMFGSTTYGAPPPSTTPSYQSNRPVSNVYNNPSTTFPEYNPPTATPTYSPSSRPVSNAYGNDYNSNPYSNPPLSSNPPYNNSSSNLGGYSPASNNRASGNYNSPAAKKQPDDLDNLLSSLTNQMDSLDNTRQSMPPPSSSTSYGSGIGGGSSMGVGMGLSVPSGPSKGNCKACQQPIYGEIIQALGAAYHPEHFSCGVCRTPIGTGMFFEYQGGPTCDRCYKESACPKCAHCDKPIMDRCVTAIGKKWHAEHFICTQCLRPFEGGVFFERDGRPYCEADFYNVFAPKCNGCGESVRGDCITALGHQWHPEHFQCNYCQKSLVNTTFFEFGGKPFCEAHYHMQTGSTCGGCGKPITGRSVTALGKKWHPEHFICAFCMNPLSGGSYSEHNAKAYCKECHSKLGFGN